MLPLDGSVPDDHTGVGAVILAAGLSRRMGQLKMTMPWDGSTVVGSVVRALQALGLEEIVVVTGHRAEEVEAALALTPVRFVFNAEYARGEMLSSLQAGLRALAPRTAAALICLGDQPQIEVSTVQAVLARGEQLGWKQVVVPSYELRAGHPIILPRRIWPAVFSANSSLRAVLDAQRELVRYVSVETPTILADLDTPEQYSEQMGTRARGHQPPDLSEV